MKIPGLGRIPGESLMSLRIRSKKTMISPVAGETWGLFTAANGGLSRAASGPSTNSRVIGEIKTSRFPLSNRLELARGDVDEMALPPCHLLYRFMSAITRFLSLYQRSADAFFGALNIASYSLLTMMVAHVAGWNRVICSYLRRRIFITTTASRSLCSLRANPGRSRRWRLKEAVSRLTISATRIFVL